MLQCIRNAITDNGIRELQQSSLRLSLCLWNHIDITFLFIMLLNLNKHLYIENCLKNITSPILIELHRSELNYFA